ncbi:hypothetical protein BA895_06000 [Humibacillus sp. DSM 29435]|uniref:hypothetical protein n=1 Tax=Humibacillus sp. DSM 29435 TaxID=1869167 RepID=UPI000872E605|nr:hypothetical protein [Humibacillus sp. DSM 29435]OFE15291.1 hypothetical protein BA895_06000 [Humibacillus sp. DSM 29435]
MILLGIVVLLVGVGAGAVTYLATAGRDGTIAVEALGFTRTASAIELAAYGLAAALVFCIGWALISAGLRRRGRVKRDERERARIDELERRASADRAESERRFEEAGRRDEDLRRRDDDLGRREKEVSLRHDRLDVREQQVASAEQALAHRRQEFEEQLRPSVADVVAGRAQGSVHDGTAEWVGPAPVPTVSAETREISTTASPDAVTEEMPRTSGEHRS